MTIIKTHKNVPPAKVDGGRAREGRQTATNQMEKNENYFGERRKTATGRRCLRPQYITRNATICGMLFYSAVSNFGGLTPKERLGERSNERVRAHMNLFNFCTYAYFRLCCADRMLNYCVFWTHYNIAAVGKYVFIVIVVCSAIVQTNSRMLERSQLTNRVRGRCMRHLGCSVSACMEKWWSPPWNSFQTPNNLCEIFQLPIYWSNAKMCRYIRFNPQSTLRHYSLLCRHLCGYTALEAGCAPDCIGN